MKILRVRVLLENNAKKSGRCNILGLSASLFNCIFRNKLKCCPDQIRIGHQLIESNF